MRKTKKTFPTIYSIFAAVLLLVLLSSYSSIPPNGHTGAVLNNQSSTLSATANSTMPDISLSNLINLNNSGEPQEVLFFNFDLHNFGDAVANGDYFINSFFSTDTIFSTDDTMVGDILTGNTPVGTISNVQGGITVPANFPAGNYFLLIVADTENDIVESNEDNNVLVSPVFSVINTTTQLLAEVSNTALSCFAANDGTATAEVSGGNAPYTYRWSNEATTASINALPAGEYSVTVTDALDNRLSGSTTITAPAELQIEVVTIQNVSCGDEFSGSAESQVAGGTPPYLILWSENAGMQLSVGSYTVTVTDQNNCTATASFEIAEQDTLTADISFTTISCFGAADGSIQVTPSGGTGPYLYSWNNGLNAQNINNLPPGNYALTIADQNGCQYVQMVNMSEPDELLIDVINIVNVNCSAEFSGSAEVQVSGGTPPYLILWSENAGMELSSGSYAVTVTDDNNCSASATFEINEEDSLSADIAFSNISCFGAADGSIQVTPSGGTGPYLYSWNNGLSSQNIDNLPPGNYALTIADQAGCLQVQLLSLTQPEALVFELDSVTVSSGVDNTGTINVSISGGAPPYTYGWEKGDTIVSFAEDPTGLAAGDYVLLLTDQNNCSFLSDTIRVETTVSTAEFAWEGDLLVFPNPSSGHLIVNLGLAKRAEVVFGLYNLLGQEVAAFPKITGMDIRTPLDLSEFERGVYLLRIQVGREYVVRRVVLQ